MTPAASGAPRLARRVRPTRGERDDGDVIPPPDPRRSWLSRALNLLAVAVVAFFATRDGMPELVWWQIVLLWLALACWAATALVPRRDARVIGVLQAVMVLAGAPVMLPSNGVLVVVVAIGVAQTVGDLARPIWLGLALAVVAGAIVPVSALATSVPLLGLVSIGAGIVVAVLAGLSRRQFRTAERQSRLLLEERVAAREELARATVLASRQQVARDIHDVLAHSLGGLVIQLDAVEALLEAGRTTDAATRVHDARALAVSGLAEARRAVDALRDVPAPPASATAGAATTEGTTVASGPTAPPASASTGAAPTVAGRELEAEVAALAQAHRTLDGTIEFAVDGRAPDALPATAGEALRRAVQESLTNARKHAPGQPVRAALRWSSAGAVELRVENPVAGPGMASSDRQDPVPGGGHGLEGMRERLAVFPQATIDAQERDGKFVVSVHLPLEPAADDTAGAPAPGAEQGAAR